MKWRMVNRARRKGRQVTGYCYSHPPSILLYSPGAHALVSWIGDDEHARPDSMSHFDPDPDPTPYLSQLLLWVSARVLSRPRHAMAAVLDYDVCCCHEMKEMMQQRSVHQCMTVQSELLHAWVRWNFVDVAAAGQRAPLSWLLAHSVHVHHHPWSTTLRMD